MITVHHLENSRSQRVLWLLEELGVPYEVKRYARNPVTLLAPPELKAVHPLGKSPVISDDGQVIAETGAIMDYLVDHYGGGRLAPVRDSQERLRYNYWMHYAEGSIMPLLVMKLIFSRLSKAPVPALIRPIGGLLANGVNANFIGPNLKTHLDFIEAELTRQRWFAGKDFSAADIQMSFPLEAASARGGADVGYPKIAAFLKTIHAMPGYERALTKGGPYQLMS